MNLFFNLTFFLSLLSPSLSCNLLIQAFNSVSNFHFPNIDNVSCIQIRELNLSSKNLTGTLAWSFLKNISTLRSVDLSHNSLHGSIPGTFFSASSITSLNLAHNQLGGTLRFSRNSPIENLELSHNRFTNAFGVLGLSKLRSLDISHNQLSSIPTGLDELDGLKYLDVSCNSMSGVFPRDFPRRIGSLRFLNLSFNNFTGEIDASTIRKFGSSAFIEAGSFNTSQHNKRKRVGHKKVIIATTISVAVSLIIIALCGAIVIKRVRERRRNRKKGWEEEERGVKSAEEVPIWVVEARWGARVVVFEKPLMELTFTDLAAATSGFGKEMQLGNGERSGAVYRAVLGAGELNVVVRVMESLRGTVETEAVEVFRELARLRHPNLLPLLGYCIAGKEKLVLYEYMEKGDLHQWLHELPSGHPGTDDFVDTWEPHQNADQMTSMTTKDWPTRHKIALGIARGLAFLHQGWAGSRQAIVHGHLVPSNILLDENLEPRIADFANGAGDKTKESNVYSYGVLVMELVTRRRKWSADEVEKVRRSVKDGKGLKEVDFGMREVSEETWEREMVECLRVGYLCTAQCPEKRPTMQQVVGLLKDIRSCSPVPIPSSASVSSCSLQWNDNLLDPLNEI